MDGECRELELTGPIDGIKAHFSNDNSNQKITSIQFLKGEATVSFGPYFVSK